MTKIACRSFLAAFFGLATVLNAVPASAQYLNLTPTVVDDVPAATDPPAEVFTAPRPSLFKPFTDVLRDFRHLPDRTHWNGREHRLPAPAFVVARAIEHERHRPAAAAAGDGVRLVHEQVARALALAKRRVVERQRRELASEQRRLVDFRAVEAQPDLRIRAHSVRCAVDGHFALAAAR